MGHSAGLSQASNNGCALLFFPSPHCWCRNTVACYLSVPQRRLFHSPCFPACNRCEDMCLHMTKPRRRTQPTCPSWCGVLPSQRGCCERISVSETWAIAGTSLLPMMIAGTSRPSLTMKSVKVARAHRVRTRTTGLVSSPNSHGIFFVLPRHSFLVLSVLRVLLATLLQHHVARGLRLPPLCTTVLRPMPELHPS